MKQKNNSVFGFSWNQTKLKTPKFEFFEASIVSCTAVKKAIQNDRCAIASRNLLFLELATLSKFMIQIRNKYRSERGFNTIRRIEKTVYRLSDLKINSATEIIKANLIGNFVPSKQLCQWFLVKLQSASQLLHRTTECSCYSFTMLQRRLQTGHSWVEVITVMAMISRIWSLATFLIKKCCKTFDLLVDVLDDLPFNSSDSQWLPSNYKFPRNLQDWIVQTKNTMLLPHVGGMTTTCYPSGNTKRKNIIIKAIKKVKSSRNLKKFFFNEKKRRDKNDKKCISKNLDALQWHMFTKRMLVWINQLRKSEESNLLLRKIRKRLRNLFL